MKRLAALAVLLSFLLNACFTFGPTGSTIPDRGGRVRLYLSQPIDVKLAQFTVNNVAVLDAEVVSAEPDVITLSTFWVRTASGYETAGIGETVTVPRENIREVQQKQLSVLQTALAVGAVAGVAALVITALAQVGGDPGGGGTGGRPN